MLPSWGEANFLPPKSCSELMPESFLTTNDAPPLVAPAITLSASPLETTYPLTAGFGPIYVASSLPASKDSIAEGPALNTKVSRVTLSPNVF